ncbi:SDR family oxidoreductase [Nocardia sp. BMG51109]|uniref:SDR family oxidoreductase n=1 Tax=Nocardia sp. BMG51109 TaxID=1056816 RepID=UPI000463C223|nr:SDR family oxidoreductase [Nocardia sp. BMG51109]
MTDLQDKVALVTGSARGVGRAIALRYASLGARVVINYAGNEAGARQTVQDIRDLGSEAVAIRADVSDLRALERLYEESVDAFGKIDIVVANAGVEIIDQPIAEVTEEQFDRLFSINTKGGFFTLQKAAEHVEDNGRIIYIGSSTTCLAIPGVGLYGASKMANRYTVEVLAQEVGNRGVTVNTIIPTQIEGAGVFTHLPEDSPTRAQNLAMRPLGGRLGRVEDVADAAEYFAGPLSQWVSGQNLVISGGLPG